MLLRRYVSSSPFFFYQLLYIFEFEFELGDKNCLELRFPHPITQIHTMVFFVWFFRSMLRRRAKRAHLVMNPWGSFTIMKRDIRQAAVYMLKTTQWCYLLTVGVTRNE